MDDEVTEAAARWHARQSADDMDWDGFTDWLEADARHRRAFDAIALLDDRIDRHRAVLRVVGGGEPTDAPSPSRRGAVARWGGAAAAAAAAAAVLVALSIGRSDRPGPASFASGPTPRTLELAGGVRADLAPRSEVRVQLGAPNRLAFSGRATFDVRHDPDRPLTIVAAGYTIEDVGTRFEVATGDGIVRVGVAEGVVAVTPPGASPVRITAGQVLTGDAAGLSAIGSIRPADVGGRREGPLVYEAVPLGIVVADLSRASGRAIGVDPTIRQRPFSGVLAAASGDRMANALAGLAGLRTRRAGDTIVLVDRARP